VREVLARAAGLAAREGRSEVGVEDLLLALAGDPDAATVLFELGVDEAMVRQAVERRRAEGQ
jgi:ATP-dependent Clp protease ATP-binding subunit ClpA